MDSYKRTGVPLAYALASFLPVAQVSCPLLVVVVPLRDSSQLRCGALTMVEGSKHELVVVLENLRTSVRYVATEVAYSGNILLDDPDHGMAALVLCHGDTVHTTARKL